MHLTYDMRIGGTEMVIKNLLEGSDPKLFAMSIFCIEEPLGPWGKDLQNNGIPISSQARQPGFDKSLIFAIRKHIKQHKVDILHCHQYTPWVYGVLAAIGTKTKVIFTEHGRFYPDSSTWKRKLINPWLCKITDCITSISKATKLALAEFERIPENRIEVIYNGIKTPEVDTVKVSELRQKLGISENTKVLGTIARLDSIKNHRMMIEAFALVLKGYPDTVLIIVGDGEERDNIESQIKQLGISNNVILPGYDPQPQHYLALMDIFLLSSLSEGTSMTLLEAMSLGKPCVVTNAGGNPEIIDDKLSGYVSKNDNFKDFAEKILFLCKHNQVRESFGSESKRIFNSKFSHQSMVNQYQQICIQLTETGS
ncbi:glycosyltransferase [Paraglaciecola arctica]|nr:glycosyltransferase [Paraglaciecola arctica]MBU3005713.1 glycosyltransferase [Paraglaciecola arctica]